MSRLMSRCCPPRQRGRFHITDIEYALILSFQMSEQDPKTDGDSEPSDILVLTVDAEDGLAGADSGAPDVEDDPKDEGDSRTEETGDTRAVESADPEADERPAYIPLCKFLVDSMSPRMRRRYERYGPECKPASGLPLDDSDSETSEESSGPEIITASEEPVDPHLGRGRAIKRDYSEFRDSRPVRRGRGQRRSASGPRVAPRTSLHVTVTSEPCAGSSSAGKAKTAKTSCLPDDQEILVTPEVSRQQVVVQQKMTDKEWAAAYYQEVFRREHPGEPLPPRRYRRPRGRRLCPITGCSAMFDGHMGRLLHIYEVHCPPGIEEPLEMARALLALRDQVFPNDYNWRTTMQYVANQVEGAEYMYSWQYRIIATRTAEILGTLPPAPQDFQTFMQGRIEVPTILVHPRIISVLIDRLSEENQRRFRSGTLQPFGLGLAVESDMTERGAGDADVRRFATMEGAPIRDSAVQHLRAMQEWVDHGSMEPPPALEDMPNPPLALYDCGFFPEEMTPSYSGSEHLRTFLDRGYEAPVEMVNIRGGVACHRGNAQPLVPPTPGFIISRGFRPALYHLYAAEMIEDEVIAIQRNRWVVGPMALDYTLPQSRAVQREMLAAACRVLQPYHVLIIELRGVPTEEPGYVQAVDLLDVLFDSGVPEGQPIVIRESPIGRQAIVQLESSRRNFYYAISAAGSYWQFDFENSMLRMPRRKILVESSSPNYACGGAPLQGMKPKFLAGVLRYISQTLDMNIYDTQDMVNRNFERCFGRYFPL